MQPDPIDPRIEYWLFQDPCPSFACGKFVNYRWEFYGRWDHWDFTLSTDMEVDPDGGTYRDSLPEDIPPCVFFRQRRYCPDGAGRAGYISEKEMQELVRQCVLEFEQEHSTKHS